ncbi:hypothetical protein ACVDG3_02115 [Meridianimarinicoccus sp. RP-17]
MARKPRQTVMGVHAPPPRPTRAGALWVSIALAVPVGALLGAIEIAWRLLR